LAEILSIGDDLREAQQTPIPNPVRAHPLRAGLILAATFAMVAVIPLETFRQVALDHVWMAVQFRKAEPAVFLESEAVLEEAGVEVLERKPRTRRLERAK